MLSSDQIKPRPGWALCRSLKPVSERPSGLIIARDLEDTKTTEGVCEILAVEHKRAKKDRRIFIPLQFAVGDVVLFRDFLKNANQVGSMVGEEKNNRVFLLSIDDILAVLNGTGDGSLTVGHYGEYRL